jgi:hypothetical protein
MELFTQKIDTKLSKIWVFDPGSGSATLVKIKIFSKSFPHFRNIHCTMVQAFLFSRMNKLKKAF